MREGPVSLMPELDKITRKLHSNISHEYGCKKYNYKLSKSDISQSDILGMQGWFPTQKKISKI